MKDTLNYYQVLHVAPDAPREIIRASYRALMQKLRMHPDLGGNRDTAVLINEAYSTLANPSQRAAYDEARRRASTRPGGTDPQPARRPCLPGTTVHLHCVFCGAQQDTGQDGKPAAADCGHCHSPLPMSGPAISDEDGRREVSRIPKEQMLVYWTRWPQQQALLARSNDISLSGMKFNCSQSLTVGQVVKIDASILRATARVVRCHEDGARWGVAVQFLSLCFDQACGSFIIERV